MFARTLDIKVDHIYFKLKINRPAISTLFHNGLASVYDTAIFKLTKSTVCWRIEKVVDVENKDYYFS